jgi:cyclic dehypoxanthinyl futalosine synthase
MRRRGRSAPGRGKIRLARPSGHGDFQGAVEVTWNEERKMEVETSVGEVAAKVEAGERITVEDARVLWHEATDDELKHLAGLVRARYHAPDEATYLVMRIINYTNVCVAQCDYCAFYVLPNQEGGYVLSREDVFAKIDELVELGGDLVGFNGGFNPKLPLHYYCDLFRAVRERYGDRVEFYALTIAEFIYLADRAQLSFLDTARKLRDAGVRWITGGGSEILTEDFRRRHSKFKYTVREYFEAQRAVVEAGLNTTATMVIGFDETLDERLEHLSRTRDFQDETGGLFSFLCWTYKPYGTDLGGGEVGAEEYYRHIALSRIFLDNVRHFRTSVLTLNEDAFRALDFGANDFDLPVEDEVTQKAGARIDLDLEGLLAIPRSMGYRVQYRRAARELTTGAV